MSDMCSGSLLLLLLLGLSHGDVGDFSPCLSFFYRARPPTGIAGTPICQRYENRYHFATLYSRERRAPWFSGYVFSPPLGKRPRADWKYEPQVRTRVREHRAQEPRHTLIYIQAAIRIRIICISNGFCARGRF